MGALTEHHRCPRGPIRRLADSMSVVGVGGILGIVVTFAIDDSPPGALLLASAALGAVLASAVRQALGPRP
jgi:peptidoglycan/LPS O-acetylase OafA/YrhL